MKMIEQKSNNTASGFTLIEVVFVIVIFAIMASIVLFRFNDFGTRTELENTAQDVALRIVEAQKSAISGVTNVDLSGGTETLAPTYGIYFSNIGEPDNLNRQFTFFSDSILPKNGLYNTPGGGCPNIPTSGNECISVTTFNSGDYVSNIGYKTPTGAAGPLVTAGTAHISFTRPWPTAQINICSDATLGTCSSTTGMQSAYIEITSGIDPALQKTIVVTSLGKVHVVDGSICTILSGIC